MLCSGCSAIEGGPGLGGSYWPEELDNGNYGTWFWSSTAVEDREHSVWYLNFLSAEIQEKNLVWAHSNNPFFCVRPSSPGDMYSPPDDTYSAPEDTYSAPEDTWKDPISGLTWQVKPTGGGMDWSDAKAHCSGLLLAGGGWHLPTISELRALIRGCPEISTGGECGVTDGCLNSSCADGGGCLGCPSNKGPADGCYWPDEIQGTCYGYWSSSAVADITNNAWIVRFREVDIDDNGVNNTTYVRCVR